MTSKRTLVQDCSSDSVFIAVIIDVVTNLKAGLLVSGLFCEPASGERLLHGGGDKDTAFAVLRLRAAVESYAGTSRDLDEDRQGTFETRGLRDLNFVDQGGNKVVGIFEGVADVVQTFHEEAGTLVDVVRGAIEFAVDGFAGGHVADEFIVHKKTQAKN